VVRGDQEQRQCDIMRKQASGWGTALVLDVLASIDKLVDQRSVHNR
jgi:hypothetical protein